MKKKIIKLKKIDDARNSFFNSFDIDISMDSNSIEDNDINAILEELSKSYQKEKYNGYFDSLENQLMHNIIKPFGLARVLFDDKDGGNVTTIHNANKGIYAQDSDRYVRNNYDDYKNSDGKKFKGSNGVGSEYTRSQLVDNNKIIDEYTGKIEQSSNTSPDHIESLSQYHKDGGFMQNNQQKADFATDQDNLAITQRAINQSMRGHDKTEWKEKNNQDGISNKEKYNIDGQKIENAIKRGREAKENHLPSNIEKGMYYFENSVMTGALEGFKMGLQQAIGLFLQELIRELFIQAKDIYNNNWKKTPDDTFFETIGKRLREVSEKVALKWKEILAAFKDGAVSGFISNIITVLINTFITTSKKLVRFIREGIMSLIKAIKIIMNPPEDMTQAQIYHEATKIITAGVFVGIGIMIEEGVNKYLDTHLPYLTNFVGLNINETISIILVGSIVTLQTGLMIFLLDKIDLFGAEHENRFNFMMSKLNEMCQVSLEEINENHKNLNDMYYKF